MTVVSFSEAKSRLEEVCSKAVEQRGPVFLRRDDNEDMVLLPAEEYESIAETVHLLASPANAARLIEAIIPARTGTTAPMSVEELRAAVGL